VILRLDDAFGTSSVATLRPPADDDDDPVLAAFEFDDDQQPPFAPEGGERPAAEDLRIEDGVLVVDHVDNRTLVARLPRPVAAADVVEIHLRARLRAGWEVTLGWRGAGADTRDGVSLTGPPGAGFRTYRIDGPSLFGSHPDATITHLTLRCPGPAGLDDRLEVDFIRLVDSPAMFHGRSAGVGRLTHAGEHRPVLFVRAGTRIEMPVSWPHDDRIVLSTGTASVEASGPLTVDLSTTVEGGPVPLGRLDIPSPGPWRERHIELRVPPTADPVLTIRVEGSDGIALLSSPMVYRPLPRPRRILFIVQDALRADHLSLYGAVRSTSPFTERLARRGAVFRRAIAQAPATRMSVASYFTSLHPTAAGVRTFEQTLADEYVTLAEILRHAGYATASVIENGNAGVLGGLHQGFDRVLEIAQPTDTLSRRVPTLLEELPPGRPAFVYVHLLDPHGPYDPPPGHRGWLESIDAPVEAVDRSDVFDPPWITTPSREGRTARYDGEISANDRALEGFFENLEALGWSDQTLIVMASDHGEYLGEHGQWGHHAPGWPEVLHTPLILIDSDRIPRDVVVDEPVQNLDLVPTILELVDLDPTALPFQGESLAAMLRARSPAPERLAVSEENRRTRDIAPDRHAGAFAFGRRYVLHSPPVYHRVFDWRGVVVGRDATPLSTGFGAEISAWFGAMHREHAAIAEHIAAGREQVVSVDADTVDNLRALGYVVESVP
jgi:hypothetical protein